MEKLTGTKIFNNWQSNLRAEAKPDKVRILSSFFKTGKGEYGEGDVFIGVTVPANRTVARKFLDAPESVIEKMLSSEIHEFRLSAIISLVEKFKRLRKAPEEQNRIIRFYLSHTDRINNWDLVDLSAPTIIGSRLSDDKMIETVRRLAKSDILWERRIAMVSTLYPVTKQKELSLALELAAQLLGNKEPLMHKAVGWVLREVGKKDITVLRNFLSAHVTEMAATALSYATEKMDKTEREHWRKLRKM